MSPPRRYASDEDAALDLFRTAPVVHLASTLPDGAPVLRTVHAVVLGRALLFHGAAEGEKLGCVGREAVISAERVIARIPSYFVDPNIACPATTYYESAMAQGRVASVEDLDEKAAALEQLMHRYQPEGRHAPITTAHPTYASALRSIFVGRIELEHIAGKRKLGQNRSRRQIERVVEQLWQRGDAGDLQAMEPILAAHPDAPDPPLLRGPGGTRLCPAPTRGDLPTVTRLLEDQYWARGESAVRLAEAHERSAAWVGVRGQPGGDLIGSARAISDGTRHAYVADVVVAPEYRGLGLGRALVKLLLEHPMLRRVGKVRLTTKDATPFYASLGFRDDSPPDLVTMLRAGTP